MHRTRLDAPLLRDGEGGESPLDDATGRRRLARELELARVRLGLAHSCETMAFWWHEPGSGRLTWEGERIGPRLLGLADDGLPTTRDGALGLAVPEDREAWAEVLDRSPTRSPGILELRLQGRSGPVWVVSSSRTLPADDEHEALVVGVLLDIDPRKQVEHRLRVSNELLRSIVDASPLAVIATDLAGRVTIWNQAAHRLFGWEADEVVGGPLPFFPAELAASAATARERALAGEIVEADEERVCKDGSRLEVSTSLALRRGGEGQVVGLVGVAADVSERNRARRELEEILERLRDSDSARQKLLHQLVRAQEEERRRVAGDIHDDSIQAMTAVGMQLAALGLELGPAAAAAEIGELERTVSLAIRRLRRLVFELRPAELDRGGLAAAIRPILEQLRSDDGIEYTFEHRLASEPPAEVRAVAYRIAREALVNIRKHARARTIDVSLISAGTGFTVRIADDGLGFSQPEAAGRARDHIGLLDMRERAAMAGGRLRIESEPGSGTTVTCWLPYEFGAREAP